MPPRVIYWFRTDLRLHDSPALQAALDLKPAVLFPIWCWDNHYVFNARVGVNRWQFLLDCMEDVSRNLSALNKKQKLFVLREPAVSLLPKLFKAWKITHLAFESDTDAYGRQRDEKVLELAKAAGVKVVSTSGRTLYDSDLIVKANHNKPTMSIKALEAAGDKVGKVPSPIDAPNSLPDPGELSLDFEQESPATQPDFNKKHRDSDDKSFSAGLAGPSGDFAVPALKELGMKPATTPHKGGESIALKMLDELLAKDDYVGQFEKPKTSPAAFEPQSTCLTSPYLHVSVLNSKMHPDLNELSSKTQYLVHAKGLVCTTRSGSRES